MTTNAACSKKLAMPPNHRLAGIVYAMAAPSFGLVEGNPYARFRAGWPSLATRNSNFEADDAVRVPKIRQAESGAVLMTRKADTI